MSHHVPSISECLTRRLEDLSSGLAQKTPATLALCDFSGFQRPMDGQKHPGTRNSWNMSEQWIKDIVKEVKDIKVVPNLICPYLPKTMPAGHPGPLSTPHCGGLGQVRVLSKARSFEIL